MDEKINKIIKEWEARPFKWGAADCCQFVWDASAFLTGIKMPIAPYSTERGAIRVLKNMGGYDAALQSHGYQLLESPLLAQRGDIVAWVSESNKNAFSAGLGLCVGQFVCAKSKDGLVFIDQPSWLKAWRFACHKQ